jgi:DNA-binding response OmpR family regulator
MSRDIRVLVGDDDVNDRYFLEWGFKETSPWVHLDFARSGEEVIQYLEDNSRPRPSLLIIDSMMPRRDGFAVLAWLRSRTEFEHLPVVMLSGQPFEKNEARARELGVREYVGKPHDLEELKALVESWRQKYLKPAPLETSLAVERQFQFLIGDGNSNFRMYIQKVVAEAWPDAAVRFFQDGAEILKYFEAPSQALHSLLLLDLGTTSLDVLKWLRREKQFAELPIVIWTSTPVRVEEELAHEFGATEYLKKPNTFAGLLQTIYDLAHRYGARKD